MNGIIGKKIGMTRVFDEGGKQIPVTVLEAGPCVVTQVKSADRDGYCAVQLGFEENKESRCTKARVGHCARAGVSARRVLREFRIHDGEAPEAGSEVNVSIFKDVPYVDVVGTSKGKGFQGVMKRWGMAGGRATHGSHNKRGPGSIGMCEWPARVLRGRKMAGRLGHTRITVQNVEVVAVREDDNALLVRGSVPGANGTVVMIREALKKPAGAK